MATYNGKLHETAVKFPNTDIWMDTCALIPLTYAIERGSVGATSNPVIVGDALKSELPDWDGKIRTLVKDNPDACDEDIAWMLIDEMGRRGAGLFSDVFAQHKGKKGRLSIQTNPRYFMHADKMLEHAKHLSALAPNMQIKMPITPAGLKAFEEATYAGISINATVSFTLDGALMVAEAVERGLKRREAEGLDTGTMAPVCTIMIGRIDDWLKEVVARDNIIVDPEALEWAGVAVCKKAYQIYNERGYRTRLLLAAYRNHLHWSQFIGGDLAMTIPYVWHQRFNESNIEVVSRIDEPVPQRYIDQLLPIWDFAAAYNEGSLTAEQLPHYGAFIRTISAFCLGYDSLCQMTRGYIIGDPMTK